MENFNKKKIPQWLRWGQIRPGGPPGLQYTGGNSVMSSGACFVLEPVKVRNFSLFQLKCALLFGQILIVACIRWSPNYYMDICICKTILC